MEPLRRRHPKARCSASEQGLHQRQDAQGHHQGIDGDTARTVPQRCRPRAASGDRYAPRPHRAGRCAADRSEEDGPRQLGSTHRACQPSGQHAVQWNGLRDEQSPRGGHGGAYRRRRAGTRAHRAKQAADASTQAQPLDRRASRSSGSNGHPDKGPEEDVCSPRQGCRRQQGASQVGAEAGRAAQGPSRGRLAV